MKYLEHMYKKKSESPINGQEILKKIPKILRDEIFKDFFGKILQNSKIFKFNFSELFLKELTSKMREVLYGPGEIIFQTGEKDHRIFYINKGSVELFLEKYQKNNDEDNTY